MFKNLFYLFLFCSLLGAKTFQVATYNVENLFDNKYDGTEYKEYIPKSKFWDEDKYNTKFSNVSKVIKDLNADIIALQEIENESILKELANKLSYPYSFFDKKSDSAIGLGILSKIPIQDTIIHPIYKQSHRNILQIKFTLDNYNFSVFINHWNSKRKAESSRIISAYSLQKILQKIPHHEDYILVGDFNSNYDEFKTFKYEQKLNDTDGITGINQILNTTLNGNFVQKENILYHKEKVHFNPWLELNTNERFSTKFKKYNNTPDHIILSSSLFDNYGISYIENSFNVFKPNYLYQNNKVNRWNNKTGKGYSDHLPLMASFTTDKIKQQKQFEKPIQSIQSIKDLYQYTSLVKPIVLENVYVALKENNIAILKRDNDRSIKYYSKKNLLEPNTIYTLKINKIDTYKGNLEIKELEIINEIVSTNIDVQFKDGTKIDLMDESNQNEVVTNLKGIYSKHKLLLLHNNKSISIYFSKGVQTPKENSTITIKRSLLSKYNTTIQLVIFSQKDFID